MNELEGREWPLNEIPGNPEGLERFQGERITLFKSGTRNEMGKMEQFPKPYYMQHGMLKFINRGGAPSAYIYWLREWFMTSEVVHVQTLPDTEEDIGGIDPRKVKFSWLQITTLNSQYLIRLSQD